MSEVAPMAARGGAETLVEAVQRRFGEAWEADGQPEAEQQPGNGTETAILPTATSGAHYFTPALR